MTVPWLGDAVAACGLPPPRTFPRNLAVELISALPVTLEPLAGLTSDGVRDWLAQREVHHRVAETPRSLHGCMVARAGCGALIYDSQDSESEQRFTLAHEVAHFVLDHLQPRLRALRVFGEKIRPVLDGLREPELDERLFAVLDNVRLGVQIELMDRGPSGSICIGNVAKSEQRADRLALELLAPEALARAVLREAAGRDAEELMAARFGLPAEAARPYVRMLRHQENGPRFSLLEFLENRDER